MLSFILRALYFIVGLWLLRAVVAWLVRHGPRRRATGNAPPNGIQAGRMVKDPVCGMYMDPRLAVLLENRDGTFFFCSPECRDKYLGSHQ